VAESSGSVMARPDRAGSLPRSLAEVFAFLDMHAIDNPNQQTDGELTCDTWLATLAARHAGLEQAIAEEWGRPAPNTLCLTRLKRRKLRIKEIIVGLLWRAEVNLRAS